MITWISTGSFTDQYPKYIGGIQLGEFSIAEELAKKSKVAQIKLITIQQDGEKESQKYFKNKLKVYRIPKPYTFSESTDTEFRVAFGIRAKNLAHGIVVRDSSKHIFHLCSAVSARVFFDWDMSDSFSETKRPFLVYSVHNALTLTDTPTKTYFGKEKEWKIQRDAEIACIQKADKVICTSSWFSEFLRKRFKLDKDKLLYIPNTVGPSTKYDKVRRYQDTQWNKTVLYLGRLAPEKKVDNLLIFFNKLVKKRNDVTLVIAGDGPDKKKLQALAKRIGLTVFVNLPPRPGAVHFLGFVQGDKKLAILKSSRMAISLSTQEVSPLVGYECLALGVPMVVPKIPQWTELITNKENGLVVNPNDVGQILVAVEEILLTKRPDKYSQANRQKYKAKFSSEAVTELRWEKVYKSLLNT